MKAYLAAPYSMKEVVSQHAEELRAAGIEVTSSWLKEPHKPTTQMNELTHEQHQQYAFQDVEDVLVGDILVFHTDPTGAIVRAGRHCEFGMAIMKNRLGIPTPIFVVGEQRENIFHHLPYVYHFSDWQAAKEAILWYDSSDVIY